MTKKLIWAIAFVFIASFIVSPHVNAAEANYFDIEFSSDKDSYELDDEVSSTITISNSSEVYDAENVEIKTTLPEEFDVVDEDIEVEDGEIIWDVDQINHGESTELTVKTKLKQSVIDKTTPADENDEKEEDSTNKENENKEDEKSADDEEETDQHAPTADVNDNNQGTDGMVAPQTGDDSSILTYVLILIVSVVVGAIALFLIRKKSLSKTLPFILAFALLTPVASVAAEVDKDNVETNTTNHELTIGDDTYQLETTITGEMNDNRGQIPVTGTA